MTDISIFINAGRKHTRSKRKKPKRHAPPNTSGFQRHNSFLKLDSYCNASGFLRSNIQSKLIPIAQNDKFAI